MEKKERQRLLALDGIRGFAALAVTISHITINSSVVSNTPILNFIVRVFSAGPTSVQLFFVLSGFLMAYLYPTVSRPVHFWQKRYLRIFPLFATIVIGLWLANTYFFHAPPFTAIGIVLAIAVVMRLLWICCARLQKTFPYLGLLLFFSFVALQFSWIAAGLFTNLGPGAALLHNLDPYQKSAFDMIANLTMTMYLQKDLIVFEGVFWSLVPEICFYLLYPIIVVPILLVARKSSAKVNILLLIAVTIIIFQLDTASRSMFFLHGMFISRAAGFVWGVVLGSLYRTQPEFFKKYLHLVKKPIVSFLLLALFAITMAWEWPDRYHQIRQFVMFHYLGLSIIFSAVIGAGLAVNSLIEKIFRHRFFTNLGKISYSLYLIHPLVIDKMQASGVFVHTSVSALQPLLLPLRVFSQVFVSILVATLLYDLVEQLYFTQKRGALPQGEKKKASFKVKITTALNKFKFITIPLGAVFILGLFTIMYSSDTVPSIISARSPLTQKLQLLPLSVTANNPQTFQFTATHSHLSAIQLAMDYASDPSIPDPSEHPPQLVFTLFDPNGNQIVQSKRHPKQLEGEPQFPFGFPTQENSADKQYTMKIALESTNSSQEIALYPQTGIVTQYTTDHLQSKMTKIFSIITQRIRFSLFRSEMIVAILVISYISIKQYNKHQ